jgi:16S rRNA (guanine(966)-N(2))-methyltransferase RsmD
MARGLRVISGSLGGRRLRAPRTDLRPTTDRVKEALFNVLGSVVVGARVLDLFAGTGALGIEALSRGALHTVFVDDDRLAVAAVRRNLEELDLTGQSTVERTAALTFLNRAALGGPFDLVFCDPPYDLPGADVDAVVAALAAHGWLSPGATVALERPRAAGTPALPRAWQTRLERAYGDTLLVVAAS